MALTLDKAKAKELRSQSGQGKVGVDGEVSSE